MEFRSHGSKSIRGSSSYTRTEIRKKCPPFGLAVQADLQPSEDRGVPLYARSPSAGTTPSSTANALRKELRRAYLGSDSRGTYELLDSGGNPGGYIGFTDNANAGGNPLMFAPSSYLGNYLLLNGARFDFDAKVEQSTGHNVQITLSGPGGEAFFSDPTTTVTTTFESYSAPIDENLWTVNNGTWENIIANVTSLSLSLDIVNGLGPDGAVDNFNLLGSAIIPEPSTLALLCLDVSFR